MIERMFELSKHRTTILREVLAGVTTFLTMSYILVVQPSVLSTTFTGEPTGLEAGAVLLATCLASAFATALMGCYAKLPIALAPGMGQNFFFVGVMMAFAGQESPAASALAVVLVAGLIFLALTWAGVRQVVLDVMSPSMRTAIAVGIGLFIAFIGLKNGGIVGDAPSLVALNGKQLFSFDSLVFWTGLLVTLVLSMLRIPGSILVGIASATAVAIFLGKVVLRSVFGLPEIEQSAILRFDFAQTFSAMGLSFVAVFVFMDIFDTTGTLIAVTKQAGLTQENDEVPNMRQAMFADSLGTIFGACLGTSTVTSYIESAAGVEQGGRTGLTAVVVAVLFLVAIALSPLIIAVGGYAPVTAPALVVVGAMMFRGVAGIDWSDETESIPAFLVIIGIPLFFSIADGIALGLIVWPLLKIASGRAVEVSWKAYVLAILLVAYFLFIRVNV